MRPPWPRVLLIELRAPSRSRSFRCSTEAVQNHFVGGGGAFRLRHLNRNSVAVSAVGVSCMSSKIFTPVHRGTAPEGTGAPEKGLEGPQPALDLAPCPYLTRLSAPLRFLRGFTNSPWTGTSAADFRTDRTPGTPAPRPFAQCLVPLFLLDFDRRYRANGVTRALLIGVAAAPSFVDVVGPPAAAWRAGAAWCAQALAT